MSYVEAHTTEQVTQSTRLSINNEFIRSPPGILKIIELVVDIIIWICVGATPYFGITGNGGYINFAATATFIFTLILFILYFINVMHRLPGPWILIESLSLIISIVILAIAMLVGAFSFHYGGGAIAAAVFCALNATVYGVEIFLRFRLTISQGCTFTATAVDGDISTRHTVTATTTTTTTTTTKTAGNQGEFGDAYGVP